VKTGWRLGDRAEIVQGLEPGERIVVSGNFLIDSESRMKLAAAGMFGVVTKDPVCGLNVDESKAKAAGFHSTYKNQTYYFCSQGCQQHFEKIPGRYAAKPGGGQEAAAGKADDQGQDAQAAKAKDPVCGLEVDKDQAKASGLTSDYEGQTYYFCRYNCNKQFDKDPVRYLHQEAETESGVAKDPVCGLPVATGPAQQAGRSSEHQGKTYYFDTDGCKQRFDHNPQRYLSGSSGAPPVELQPYPSNPQDYDTLRQYKRTLKHMAPDGPTPGAPPATPQEPTPTSPPGATPAAPPEPAPVTPQGPTPVTPEGPPPVTPHQPQIPPPAPPQGEGCQHD
jgi:YHS domain-containing protein